MIGSGTAISNLNDDSIINSPAGTANIYTASTNGKVGIKQHKKHGKICYNNP